MARLTKEEKLKKLKEQIKKKEKLMKEIEEDIQLNIGKTIMKEWKIDDDELAKDIIIKLKDIALEELEKIKHTQNVN